MVAGLIGGAALALFLTLPLAWKWELGVRRVGLFVGAVAVAVWLPVALLLDPSAAASAVLVGVATLLVSFLFLAWRFYRDPERKPPARADVVISPADGEVIYVRRSREGRLPVATKHGRDYELIELTKTPLSADDAVVVGIAMSFLDVHVNRAPVEGRVKLHQHFPGRFGSLGRPEMVFENERATTVIERPGGMEIAIVQIASRLVRQIAAFVKPGEDVALGQRIGVIRLGSQVDVVLPARADVEVTVAPGDRVRAGESILALLP